jgi:hypothetical protein
VVVDPLGQIRRIPFIAINPHPIEVLF